MKRVFLVLSLTLLLAGCGGSNFVSPVTPPDGGGNPNPAVNPATAPMAAFITGPVTFATSSRLMYTATNDGSGQTQVFAQPRDLYSAYVLPDGSKAVFAARAADGYSQIYYLSPVNSATQPVQLTTTAVHKTGAMLSADGSKIVFLQLNPAEHTPDDARVWDVVTMNTDGSNSFVISHPEGYYMSHPFFSPDGSTLVLAMDEGYYGGDMGIFTMNADGSNIQRLTPGGPDGILGVAPAFSPDGKQVVFSSVGWDDLSVYIINSDGTGLQRIGVQDSHWGDPLFVGDRVMFVLQEQDNYQIYSVKPDGTGLRKVTNSLSNVFERGPV